MKIAAHQPNFLPNLAFFNKMRLSDLFVVISNLQFEKQEGWQQRHKIKGLNNDIWLTVPVFGSQNQKVKDVLINNQADWRKKHIKTLEMIYGKSKGKEYISEITSVYKKNWKRLIDLNAEMILTIRDILNIKTPVVIDEEVSGIKHELLINICKKYKGDIYLSGVGAREYLDETRLNEIKNQGLNHEFVNNNLTAMYPYSSIHYLFTKGKKWVLDAI
ncbi:MAG: hypothetical protein A3B44_00355 [Candidatus Levybacteria bacterium RIFCSPLOWO2_01_FULL_38_21]|nr:MAG: hypothetical protein A3B44_00355 [Candidatus Levybacteria bacterium RIFCSPLOWO2_01_FULL_38_21]